jgi:hypothetical protein
MFDGIRGPFIIIPLENQAHGVFCQICKSSKFSSNPNIVTGYVLLATSLEARSSFSFIFTELTSAECDTTCALIFNRQG